MRPKDHEALVSKITSRWSIEYADRKKFFSSYPADSRQDRLGKEITFALWLTLANDPEYCLVSKEEVEGVMLLTFWKGYKESPYVTIILKDNCILATCESEDEKAALWLHCQLIFYFDQKLWSIQDV